MHGQAFGWESVPLGRLLRSGTRLPLYIDNGVKAMGQAEMWFGAGRGAQSVVACLIGSGVGASIIANGVALRGVTSSAGEWGHSTVVVDGRPCRCGSLGCLEAYVGAEAILDQYGSRLPGADQEAELAALIDLAPTSARAADILDTTALYLGLSIADLINMFNPERIILGGWACYSGSTCCLPSARRQVKVHCGISSPRPRSGLATSARTPSLSVPPHCPSRPCSAGTHSRQARPPGAEPLAPGNAVPSDTPSPRHLPRRRPIFLRRPVIPRGITGT